MKFKNIYSHSCKLSFKGSRVEINGEFETEDKELIAFLEQAPDFVKVEEKPSEKVNKSIKEDLEETQDEPSNIEELKKYADELGVKYHPTIGVDKLQAKIDEFLDK